MLRLRYSKQSDNSQEEVNIDLTRQKWEKTYWRYAWPYVHEVYEQKCAHDGCPECERGPHPHFISCSCPRCSPRC